ncbi:MAG: hypothetical protein AUH78_20485 [Gemmatimonadetes bacterium 13_1_40CM_4_69_8]|nr:MAG: hypothetical protein AUH78_20485 [Gemmatimonadetes bacterium 13_1_40CM_4_69_8]
MSQGYHLTLSQLLLRRIATRRGFLSSCLVTASLVLVSCTRESPLPTESPSLAATSSSSCSPDDINAQISALFPTGDGLTDARQQFRTIQKQKSGGDLAGARSSTFKMVAFTLRKYYAGKLLPGLEATTKPSTVRLIDALFCFVGLPASGLSSLSLGDPGTNTATAVFGSSGGDLLGADKLAGLRVPAGAVSGDHVFAITRRDDLAKTGTCVVTTLPQFPLCEAYTVVPVTTFSVPVTVVICQLESNHPPHLRLAHQAPSDEGAIELLPLVGDPLGIVCSNAVLSAGGGLRGLLEQAGRFAARVIGPRPLYASHPATAGTTTSFSDFTAIGPGFVPAGEMSVFRSGVEATAIGNGTVLVSGGAGAPGALASAELWDPVTGSFSSAGTMTVERKGHRATLLPDGRVLISGGFSNSGVVQTGEFWDPPSQTFGSAVNMVDARALHSATLLSNGQVLLVGGLNFPGGNLGSAELYDPSGNAFVATGSMATARFRHTATLLSNGTVLIAGGEANGDLPWSSAEIYDPSAGTFSFTTGAMSEARSRHTATLLPSGQVLIVGGLSGMGCALASAELYDPVSGAFMPTGTMGTPRKLHTATLLPSGKVLIAGGDQGCGNESAAVASAELYDPTTRSFIATGSMGSARSDHGAASLPGDKVLLVGGVGDGGLGLKSAELYLAVP